MARRASADFFERHRRKMEQVWRDLRAAPLTELVGVVQPGGVGSSWSQGDTKHTLQIPLLAWRVGDGPVRRTELTLRQKTSGRAAERMFDRFKGYEVVRVRARVPEKDVLVLDSPQAMLVRFVKGKPDRELEAVAKKLRAPVRMKDKTFGVLTLDRGDGPGGAFNGRASWGTRRVALTLTPDGRGSVDKSLAAAKTLFKAHARWDRLAREKIAQRYYGLWLKAWREPEAKAITKEKFATVPRLRLVVVQSGGRFELWYDDRDLFGGHSLTVEGKVGGGVTRVNLEG